MRPRGPAGHPRPNTPPRARDLDDFDEPGDMDELSRQLWASTPGLRAPGRRRLSYAAAVRYARRAQRRGAAAAGADVQAGAAELPTGWAIAPAGAQIPTGRLPFEAVAFAGRVVVLNTGYYPGEAQPLTVVDPRGGGTPAQAAPSARTVAFGALYPAARVALRERGGDGALYVSGGDDRAVWRVDSSFAARKLPVGGYAAGLAPLDAAAFGPGRLAVAYLVAPDSTGPAGAGRLAVLNTVSGRVEQELPAGHYPTAVESIGNRVYVLETGLHAVRTFGRDTGAAGRLALRRTLAVGRNPIATCRWGEGAGARLLVVNSGSDDLSILDLARDSVVGRLSVRFRDPGPDTARTAGAPTRPRQAGSAPTSCAVAHGRVYVTLATANAVAVFDTARVAAGRPALLGYLPTGWYPTRVLAVGDSLWVLSAKGVRARRPNPNGPQPDSARRGGPDYVLTQLQGALGVVPRAAAESRLGEWTRAVLAGSPLAAPAAGAALPIKHVFYVVRENRSFDQVMGDLGRGDGDSTLTLFGRDVTPAAHALARNFVTLDHFFADGEISVLGHSYTTSGYASPLLQWLGNTAYGNRFAGYPFGTAPAVFSPAYLWDALDARGVNYRVYGEPYYASTAFWRLITARYGEAHPLARAFVAQSGRLTTARDRGAALHAVLAPAAAQGRTPAGALALLGDSAFARGLSQALVGGDALERALVADPALRGEVAAYLAHYAFAYPTWDLTYSDLRRVADWKAEFDADAAAGRVPAFTYFWLPNDHTAGVARAQLTPRQLVAQNDAALARLVETIAASPVWRESLILVEEDDAQNGPDHVDATRTVALAVGPFVRRGAVVRDRYDQLSMLRTAEVLLGLDPLGVGDALAVPMLGALTPAADGRRWRPPEPSRWLTKADRGRYDALGAGAR
ncbi:hypothetical protein tb265_21240 [Gemmatimonadetes bacterium T265]|nr:hypothetical protein tb265_21240 [Gemmatimonadetes bacterium T265]